MLGSFTWKSDVWSFGIMVWEIFELGGQPYAGITDPQDLYDLLTAGKRLSKPALAPLALYHMMDLMWSQETGQRPHFTQIREQLEELQREAA